VSSEEENRVCREHVFNRQVYVKFVSPPTDLHVKLETMAIAAAAIAGEANPSKVFPAIVAQQ